MRNRPISGTSSDVGGINFEISKRKTVNASKTEIQSDIFSPDSDGNTKTNMAKLEIKYTSRIFLTVWIQPEKTTH